jgi:23S rRNA pseudouridine1911/1915/1917 synthase
VIPFLHSFKDLSIRVKNNVTAGFMDQSLITLHTQEKDKGVRLDKWLAGHLPDLSRSRLQGLIQAGHLHYDGEPCLNASRKLTPGLTVTITLPPVEEAELTPWNCPLPILFEDEHILVLDKPAGMVVHPAPGHSHHTLVNALLHHCGDSLSGIGGIKRPGIVHRLDKDTSGVMVVAKTDQAHQHLSAQFADHGRTGAMERHYHALVWGQMSRPGEIIDAPLGRSRYNREKHAVREDGREAITHVQQLACFGQSQHSGKALASLVDCRLETGRTHQIRVHMAHKNLPVIGDPVYGTAFASRARQLVPDDSMIKRQALHAVKLTLTHPHHDTVMSWESPYPDDFRILLTFLETL